MKKYLYLIGAFGTAIFSSSCKKDFTCECTTSDSISTDAVVTKITLKDVSKKLAKTNCYSTEYEGIATYVAINDTGYSYYTTGPVTYTTDCELK